MTVELNHTIIWASDKAVSARFLAGILGVSVGGPTGPFLPIELSNRVTLDFADSPDAIRAQHYAFLIGEAEFDAAFDRIQSEGLDYWADPEHQRKGELNYRLGGRGCYFDDPDGHAMELLTRA